MAGRGRVRPLPTVPPGACDQGLCADCPPDPAAPGLSAPHLHVEAGRLAVCPSSPALRLCGLEQRLRPSELRSGELDVRQPSSMPRGCEC